MININSVSNFISNGLTLYNLITNIADSNGIDLDGFNVSSNFNGGRSTLSSSKKHSSDIWSFISAFENGYARPEKYRIEMSLPKGANGAENSQAKPANLRRINNDLNRKDSISIKCHTMNIPRRGFEMMDVRNNNLKYKIPYGISYEPVTFSFYADANLDSLRYFEAWQSSVMNYSSNTMNFFNEYVSDIKLYIMNAEGKDVYGVQLFECFPMNIAQVDLAYGNGNTVLSINVTFSYKYFLSMENTERYNRAY